MALAPKAFRAQCRSSLTKWTDSCQGTDMNKVVHAQGLKPGFAENIPDSPRGKEHTDAAARGLIEKVTWRRQGRENGVCK